MHPEERGTLWLKGAALGTTHTAGTPELPRSGRTQDGPVLGAPGATCSHPGGRGSGMYTGRVPTACRHGDTKHAEQRDAIRGPAVRVPDRAGPSATRPEPALVPPASGVGTSCSRANGLVAPVSRPDRTATRHACPTPLRAAARCPVRGRQRPRGRASRPGPAAGSQGGRGEICAVTVPGRPAAPAGRSGGGHSGRTFPEPRLARRACSLRCGPPSPAGQGCRTRPPLRWKLPGNPRPGGVRGARTPSCPADSQRQRTAPKAKTAGREARQRPGLPGASGSPSRPCVPQLVGRLAGPPKDHHASMRGAGQALGVTEGEARGRDRHSGR